MRITRKDLPWGWLKFQLNSRLVNVLVPLIIIVLFGGFIPVIWMLVPDRDLLWIRVVGTIFVLVIDGVIAYWGVMILRNMGNMPYNWTCCLKAELVREEEVLSDVRKALGKGAVIRKKAKYIHGEPECSLVEGGKYRFYLRIKKYLLAGKVAHVFFGPIEGREDILVLRKVDKVINDMKFGSWKGDGIGKK